jgi:hypothetical protein
MQPNQEQPTDWQQPAQSPPAAPFQAPVAGGSVQPVPQISEAQPIAPAEAPQPIVESQSTLAEEQLIDANSEPTEFDDEQVVDDDAALLRWEGTEYVHSSRSVKWYSIFGIATVVAVVAAIMVLKSITFAILIPVMVVALLVYVRRAPDVLQYILSRKGIHVNDKLFTFDQFKSFGVVSYNGSHSVVLVPRKRFQIGQTLYFPEEVGEQLVDMLAERLPMKEVAPDAIDRLLAKLHL